MIPVLRVIIPAVDLSEPITQNVITRGLNVDYIVDDPAGNKPVPATALYAARMDRFGVITVARTKNVLLTPDHTYNGWVIPA